MSVHSLLLLTAIGIPPLGPPAPYAPTPDVTRMVRHSSEDDLKVFKILDDMLMMSLEFSAGDDDMVQSIEADIVKRRAIGNEKYARRSEELLIMWKRERSEMLKWQVEKFTEHIKFCEKTITFFRDKGDETNAKKRELVLKQFKETLAKLEEREKKLKEGEKAVEKMIAPVPRKVRW